MTTLFVLLLWAAISYGQEYQGASNPLNKETPVQQDSLHTGGPIMP